MLRATFFSVGLFIGMWGVTLLMVDKLVLSTREETPRQPGFRAMFTTVGPERNQVIDPPDWVAFSLMSVGAVTMLYSVALPKGN